MAAKTMPVYDDPTIHKKKKAKSVFNKPMREVVKKPAKKIPVKIVQKPKPISEPEPDFVSLPIWELRDKGEDAVINLRFTVNTFKIAHGEQDVSRANLNLFLADLDAAINKVAAVFEP